MNDWPQPLDPRDRPLQGPSKAEQEPRGGHWLRERIVEGCQGSLDAWEGRAHRKPPRPGADSGASPFFPSDRAPRAAPRFRHAVTPVERACRPMNQGKATMTLQDGSAAVDASYESWTANDYYQFYYRKNICRDERITLKCLVDYLASTPRRFDRALDYGCGPTLH